MGAWRTRTATAPSRRRGWTQADRPVDARQAYGRFGNAHGVRPAGPIGAVVFEEPEHAVVGAVGRTSADVAQQAAHGPALAQGVDLGEQRLTLAWSGDGAEPEHAVVVAVIGRFVGVGDAPAGMLDDGRGLGEFLAPGGDVRRVRRQRGVVDTQLPAGGGARHRFGRGESGSGQRR